MVSGSSGVPSGMCTSSIQHAFLSACARPRARAVQSRCDRIVALTKAKGLAKSPVAQEPDSKDQQVLCCRGGRCGLAAAVMGLDLAE